MRARPSLVVLVPLALALLLAGAGCDRGGDAGPSSKSASGAVGADHRFTIEVGGKPVRMRLAVQEHERSRGLMHVPSMPEDEGMLFVFPAPRRMSFYMRNTRFPLDIGYFTADGVLQEVLPMYPHVEDGVLSTSDTIQFALEMNQGWYARHGVRPGARLDLAAVREAFAERGFPPGQVLPAP